MFRYFATAVLIGSLAFSVSCSKKVKPGGSGAPGEIDSSISAKDMKFDPLGSDSGNIEGLSTVNFAYDSATLSESAKKTLNENAEWIKKNNDVAIQIEGHCDSRGSVEYNLALGERRAKRVKNYLVAQGIDSKRLSIISYGKEKPIASGSSESAHSQNRRANFVPLPQ